MAITDRPTIERIDHGVIPSNDLGRAHRFYGTFMGGEIDHLTNLNIRGLNREVPQIVFYTLANHKGWGVALQDFPISPNPARPLEGVVYGFEVAAANLADVARAAEERKLKFHGPVEYATPCPIKESLFVLDPDGNTMELCIRRDPVRDEPQGKIVGLRRISHVRVEVTDLEQGKSLVSRYLWPDGREAGSGRRTNYSNRAEHWAACDPAQGRSSRGAQHPCSQRSAYRFSYRAGALSADSRKVQS